MEVRFARERRDLPHAIDVEPLTKSAEAILLHVRCAVLCCGPWKGAESSVAGTFSCLT